MIVALRRLPSRSPFVGLEQSSTTDMKTVYRFRCSCGLEGEWRNLQPAALLDGLSHEDHEHPKEAS